MALPKRRDPRAPDPRPRRSPPGPAPPRARAPPSAGAARSPSSSPTRSPRPAPGAPPLSARARRKQAEEAARTEAVATGERKAAARTARRARRAEGRAARRAARAERDARRTVRLRQVVRWVFPEHTRRVGRGRAVLILVLNIAPFPGLGTALYGHMERGLMQFLLTFLFLVGWVWAVFDGIRIVSASWRPPVALRRSAAPGR